MTSIYEIANKFDQIMQEVDEIDDEEIPGYVIEKFKQAQIDLKEKIDGWGYFIKDKLNSDVKSEKSIINRHKKRKKVLENTIERSKLYIMDVMNIHGGMKFKGEEYNFQIRKSPNSIHYDDNLRYETLKYIVNETLPRDMTPFLTTRQVEILDKAAVKEALKLGEKLSFAQLVQGNHLVIK